MSPRRTAVALAIFAGLSIGCVWFGIARWRTESRLSERSIAFVQAVAAGDEAGIAREMPKFQLPKSRPQPTAIAVELRRVRWVAGNRIAVDLAVSAGGDRRTVQFVWRASETIWRLDQMAGELLAAAEPDDWHRRIEDCLAAAAEGEPDSAEVAPAAD